MENRDSTDARLYSPGQVAAAAFIGSPAAACWCMSRNYRHFGQRRTSYTWLIGGLLGTIALLVGASFLPEHFPNMAFPFGYTAGFYYVAKQIHGTAVDLHQVDGGNLVSWWTVIFISILFLVVVLALFVGVLSFLPESWFEAPGEVSDLAQLSEQVTSAALRL